MPAVDQAAPITACSFCLKPKTEVGTLVAGPGVYICDGCVALAAQLIEGKPASAPLPQLPPWELENSIEDVLASLPRLAAVRAQVERSLTGYVGKARSEGATWARIGEALGMTRQSAWERFSGEE
jgi:ClpX C4-type zinc finger protein